MGARAAMPLSGNFTIGAQLVNGWNNVEDNNSGKTVGLTAAFTSSKFNWFNNYYVGPEKTDVADGIHTSAKGNRHFYDTVLNFNPAGRVSGLINFDYGIDQSPGADSAAFYGYSAAVRFIGNDTFSFSPRYDWYKDRDGLITGAPKTLQEFTMTGDIKMKEGFLTRFEYRRDWSSIPFFDRGNEPGSAKNQTTLLVGFMVFFGPKR
jgi:hypothetical protein